jgi:hypothetical protein
MDHIRVASNGIRPFLTPHSRRRLPPSTELIDDLYSFDPATMTWTQLSPAHDAPRPSARFEHGFTSAGGRLYVHGGYGIISDGSYGDGAGVGMVLGVR